MKTSMLCLLSLGFAAIAVAHEAVAQEIEFLQPDGSPAKQTEVFRTAKETRTSGMMGGMSGMMEMGGMDMDDMMGGGMDEGGMGGMMGGSKKRPAPRRRIDFFCRGVQTADLDGGRGSLLAAGKLKLEEGQTYKSRDSVRHTSAVLAIHESGYSFIPPNSRVRTQVTLRAPGHIRVETPEGIDESRFRVLTCWQNGFAWPSRNAEMLDQGFTTAPCLDDEDWRFKPRFRVFGVGFLGDDLRVPPGEVRVAIVPHEIQGTPLEGIRSGEMLFQHLLLGGPSRIVVVTGREKESVVVRMTEPKAVTFQIPKSKEASLPLWDGAPETKYFLVPHTRGIPWRGSRGGVLNPYAGRSGMGMGMGMGGMEEEMGMGMGGMEMGGGMGPPYNDESTVESIRRWSALLNEKRLERSTNLQIREASSISEMNVRFDLIHPGHYRLIRVEDDTLVTHFQQIGKPSTDGSRFTMVPAPPSSKDGSQLAIFFNQEIPNSLDSGVNDNSPRQAGVTSFEPAGSFLPDNTELAAGLPADDLANFDQNPFAPGSGGAGPQSN
ncbi:MAG: hypothetical protein AAFU85_30245, partial [Planctomycetota bacterium]